MSGAERAVPITAGEMAIADLPEVLTIERSSFADPWTLAAFLGEFRNRRAGREVARCQRTGKIVGYAVFTLAGDELHLNSIAVHPATRGRGIGRDLLERVLARAAAAGASTAWLEVRPSNVAARALYARSGFAPRGRRRGYYSADGEDALVLRRDLARGASLLGLEEGTG